MLDINPSTHHNSTNNKITRSDDLNQLSGKLIRLHENEIPDFNSIPNSALMTKRLTKNATGIYHDNQSKTQRKYVLSDQESWAHCPYQRFFATCQNERLPKYWKVSLDNKNNRFKHELIDFTSMENVTKTHFEEEKGNGKDLGVAVTDGEVEDSPGSIGTATSISDDEQKSIGTTATTVPDEEENESPIFVPKAISVKHHFHTGVYNDDDENGKLQELMDVHHRLFGGQSGTNRSIPGVVKLPGSTTRNDTIDNKRKKGPILSVNTSY